MKKIAVAIIIILLVIVSIIFGYLYFNINDKYETLLNEYELLREKEETKISAIDCSKNIVGTIYEFKTDDYEGAIRFDTEELLTHAGGTSAGGYLYEIEGRLIKMYNRDSDGKKSDIYGYALFSDDCNSISSVTKVNSKNNDFTYTKKD